MDSADADTAQRVEPEKQPAKWEPDKPQNQPYYEYHTPSWVPKTPSVESAARSDAAADGSGVSVTRLALFSWNIDFMLPFAKSRMQAALAHLNHLIRALPPDTAAVVFLQECVESDLRTIAWTGWVRDGFRITDVDAHNWSSQYYGTTTLIDARLPIAGAFRVHYAKTRMERDALFVDVLLGGRTVRLCNTHLESLALDPPYRPAQVAIVAAHMREDGVAAALAAGDFNAIEPPDRTLHEENGLKDAYLKLGGQEDSEEGYTWGAHQSILKPRFGCSRMDKVLFHGGLKLLKFERFGQDVQLADDEEKASILKLGFEKPWVTDHFGIAVEIELVDEN